MLFESVLPNALSLQYRYQIQKCHKIKMLMDYSGQTINDESIGIKKEVCRVKKISSKSFKRKTPSTIKTERDGAMKKLQKFLVDKMK